MRIVLFTVSVALVACSGSTTSSGPGGGGPGAPTVCDPADRVGTYKLTFVYQSGDCGPIDPQIISLNPAAPGSGAGAGCTLNSERWSDGNCKLERDITCTTPTGTVRTVGVTRVETPGASEVDGEATFTLTGQGACIGTYAVDYARQ